VFRTLKYHRLVNVRGKQMSRKCKRSLLSILVVAFTSVPALAEDVEAFTEPYKQVAVPAPEIGVIAEILVQEGDQVSQKQLLAKLDDTVLQASLQVAKAAKDSQGTKQSAETEVALREQHLESYRQLQGRGNATQRELDRADNEYQQSLARLQSVREDLEVKRLEYLRVKAQINQRMISAPIDGYVVAIDKEVGEFVSPTDPIVLHVAHLKSLKTVFSVPMEATNKLQPGHTVKLKVGFDGIRCSGVIEFVSPIADAESSTVRVKIRIPNEQGKLQSGVACRWDLNSKPPVEGLAEKILRDRDSTKRGSSKRVSSIQVPTIR
jgi:RND family efflux transporter MFP subunit